MSKKNMSLSYDNEFLRSRLYVPVGSGVIATGAVYSIIGSSANRPYGVHPAVAFGAAVAIASNISDMSKDYVLDNFTSSDKADMIASITGPALTGAAAVLVSTVILKTPTMQGSMYMFAIGAGSEVASQYISENILSNAF